MKNITSRVQNEILHLEALAKKDGWVVEYDPELDSLEWGLPKMPRTARLYNVNKEISLYLTPRGLIKGVFIEYYRNNFVQHNDKFKKFAKLLGGAGGRKRIVKFTSDTRANNEVGHYIDDLAKEVTVLVISAKKGTFVA